MRRETRAMAGAVAVIGALAAAVPATAADRVSRSRVVAAEGVAKGNADRRVEVLVVVPAGASARSAGDRALAAQGAARAKPKPPPPQSNGYTFTGLKWDVLPVRQSYNPAGQRVSGAQALTNTYNDWSSVSGSTYRIAPGANGGMTTRCPSLVQECPGAQRNDRFNDVGWARLSNGTLGVTWSTSGIDEADMAINTRYAWNTGCVARPNSFDLESVYLHENGHVAGLGHSTNVNAVMYPSYQTARCALAQDDKNGIAALY
jgi:Matrixin